MYSKLYNIFRRGAKFLEEDAVLVYTMGKVGSSAIEEQLNNAIHTHTLYGFPPCEPYHLQRYGRIGVFLRRLIVYPLKRCALRCRKRIKIITLYRDPKTRNPSMFMQDLPFWLVGHNLKGRSSTREENKSYLIEAYRDSFPHDYPEQWVKRELSNFTGISYADLSLGSASHRIVERGKYVVFIGKTEYLETFADEAAKFVNVEPEEILVHSNRGAEKWYAPLYAEFIKQISAEPSLKFSTRFRVDNGYQGETNDQNA